MEKKNITNKTMNPCPYCGGNAEVKKALFHFDIDIAHKYYVECTGCKAATDQYNTYFGYLQPGMTARRLTEKEAIDKAISDWNNKNFNDQTKLSHMSDTEKAIWWIKKLLFMVWYGAMIPVDSPEYKTGWELRKIAEGMELLKLHSEIRDDLGEVSRRLFDDRQVKDIIYQYLGQRDNVFPF